jgi:hypothetical protein
VGVRGRCPFIIEVVSVVCSSVALLDLTLKFCDGGDGCLCSSSHWVLICRKSLWLGAMCYTEKLVFFIVVALEGFALHQFFFSFNTFNTTHCKHLLFSEKSL